jgi:hypothetical protein
VTEVPNHPGGPTANLHQPVRTHYHFKKDKPLLSVLASLAKSLIYDLGLNKVPTEPYITACFKSVAPHSRELKALDCQRPPREKTNDERRAVLACFYLTSQSVLPPICHSQTLTCHPGFRIPSNGWMP